MDPKEAKQAWLQASEKVKDRVIAPTLYQALELGVGITVEGDYFILGFSNADMPMAGHLRSSQHQAIIEQCISETIKKKVRLRIIEGTTYAEYENVKKMQARAEANRQSLGERRTEERQVEQAWEAMGEKITRSYAKLQHRQFAQAKAQFMFFAFGIINEGVKQLGYDEQTASDVQRRALARVFEKFSTCVEVSSSMLAYEFFKLKAEGKLK